MISTGYGSEAAGHGSVAVPAAGMGDELIGRIFRDARAYAELTREDLALRLGTTATVIEDFEAGALHNLPSWPETRRVVEGYASLVNVNPRPLLAHLEAHFRNRQTVVVPVPIDAQPVPPPMPVVTLPPAAPITTRRVKDKQLAPRFWRRNFSSLAIGGLVVLGAASMYWSAYARPAALMAAIRALPTSIADPIRSAMDAVVEVSAPKRDGLRWIEVADPQSRKGDKLRVNDQ